MASLRAVFAFAMQRKELGAKKSIDQPTVANLVQSLLWLQDGERARIADMIHEILDRR